MTQLVPHRGAPVPVPRSAMLSPPARSPGLPAPGNVDDAMKPCGLYNHW